MNLWVLIIFTIFAISKNKSSELLPPLCGSVFHVMNNKFFSLCIFSVLSFHPVGAQNIFHRLDSMLTIKYRKGNIDTAYIMRPETKWTIKARLNVSGTKIEAKGIENGQHFKSEIEAERKATISLGISYLGISVSASLNPSQLAGKYSDYELSINSYGRRFGFDIVYQDAHNFTGWHDQEGMGRIELPDDKLKVKTLNLNAFYVFNSRRFSYPAAFSQSYIQRRSAGSLLLAISGMGQRAELDWENAMHLKITNLSIGAGYGYNYVPGQGWLLHISALPTFIVYHNTSMTYGETDIPLHYHFPEAIITGRGAVLRQWGNKFIGMSMVFNFTNNGNEKTLTLNNTKWNIRTFFGVRLGKK